MRWGGGPGEGREAQPGPGSCLPGTVAVIKEEELSLYGEDPSTRRRHMGEHRRGTTHIVTSRYKGHPIPILPGFPGSSPELSQPSGSTFGQEKKDYFLPPPSSHV